MVSVRERRKCPVRVVTGYWGEGALENVIKTRVKNKVSQSAEYQCVSEQGFGGLKVEQFCNRISTKPARCKIRVGEGHNLTAHKSDSHVISTSAVHHQRAGQCWSTKEDPEMSMRHVMFG